MTRRVWSIFNDMILSCNACTSFSETVGLGNITGVSHEAMLYQKPASTEHKWLEVAYMPAHYLV